MSTANSLPPPHTPRRRWPATPYTNDTYVGDNLAVLHIYFRCSINDSLTAYRHLHFMRNERDQLYRFVTIVSIATLQLSNIGEPSPHHRQAAAGPP